MRSLIHPSNEAIGILIPSTNEAIASTFGQVLRAEASSLRSGGLQ